MVTAARYEAVDSHTEGMPTRVIVGGIGVLPGDTMLERKLRLEREHDEIRQLLMNEPRGHGAMSGAILQPPCRDDADWGVVFVEVSGYLPMCGHGTIGVATVLVETGRVAVTEPETVVRLDVPAGLVEARVRVADGRATSVTIRNVPSFVHELDGAGRWHPLRHGVRRQLLRHRRRGGGGAPGRPRERPGADRRGPRADGGGARAGPS